MNVRKNILGSFLGLAVGIVTLIILLSIFNYYESESLSRKKSKVTISFVNPGDKIIFPEWHEIGGYPPLSQVLHYGTEDGSVKFETTYRHDKRGLRIENENNGVKKTHLIIGGCSFVYGTAVKDDETLSSNFRRKYPTANVVNFGYPGGGLQTQLRATELFSLRDLASEDKGTYLYFFYYFHLERWIGTPLYLMWAPPSRVHYEVENDKLIRMQLSDSEKFKDFQNIKKYGLDLVFYKWEQLFRKERSSDEIKSFMKGVEVLRERYLMLYPEGRFVFVFSAFMQLANTHSEIKMLLDEKGIEYLELGNDYDSFFEKSGNNKSRISVPIDTHPNGLFNEFLSDVVGKKLKL